MMNVFEEFIATYGTTILYTVLTAIAGYCGVLLKRAWQAIEKKSTVKTVVEAVEQLKKTDYKELTQAQIKEKAVEGAMQIFKSKNIKITEFEVDMLIESVINGFNSSK